MPGPNVPIIGQKKEEPAKVMIGIPYYNGIHPKTMAAVIQTTGAVPLYFQHMWHGTANVVQGRNVISDAFLESDCDWLWFVDADMVFNPQQFVELYEQAVKNDADIMAGIYTKRDGTMTPLCGKLQENGLPPKVDDHIEWLIQHRGEVVECDLMPTGFMLINRRAFELGDREKPFFYRDWPWKDQPDMPRDIQHSMWSSDNVFVRDTRENGGRVFAHLGIELGHIGDMVWTMDHFHQQAHEFTTNAQVQRAKAELGEKYGYDSADYWNGLYAVEGKLGKFRNYPDLYNAVRMATYDQGEEREVLDVGSGPGVLASMLQEDGHNVTVADISEYAVEFAKQKFAVKGFVFDIEKDKVEHHAKFDVVVATELLEHIEDVPGAIKKLYSFLKPGGLLLVSTPDNCLPPEQEPEHKQLVTEAGMRTWLKPLDEVEVVKINTPPFPKLLGMGRKPEKN